MAQAKLASSLRWLEARPRLTALGLGAFSATGFQPLSLWPVALVAMAGFIALLGRAGSWRQAGLWGWLFGLGHFTVGNNWIATAFTYQAEMPSFLGWLAVPLLALYLAVYPALAAAGARRIATYSNGWALVLAFSGSWIIAEWLRSWVFTGYAWNPFGIVLLGDFHSQGLALLAPLLGTYALSGLAVGLAGMVSLLMGCRRFGLLVLLAALTGSLMHWPAAPGPDGTLQLTLVQPDLRQEDLNNSALFDRQLAHIAGLSLPRQAGVAGQTRLVLWPESGVPFYLLDRFPPSFGGAMSAYDDPDYARARIGSLLGSGGLLMTGVVDLEMRNGAVVGARNAVTAIDSVGAVRAGYAKAHLVPYGEYLPMRWLLEPLGASRLVAGGIDFLPGPGPRTLELGRWGQAGVQVCYEIVFSGQVVDRAHRPDYLFNPSNDGWFGRWGPPQHLAQARLRAIEEGLPVLRSTTTGISAVIDSRGIVREHLLSHVAGRIDTLVPPPAPPTLFAKLGNLLPLGWAIVLLALAFVATRRLPR
jgi:apolipoprotein N-acyltransferase